MRERRPAIADPLFILCSRPAIADHAIADPLTHAIADPLTHAITDHAIHDTHRPTPSTKPTDPIADTPFTKPTDPRHRRSREKKRKMMAKRQRRKREAEIV